MFGRQLPHTAKNKILSVAQLKNAANMRYIPGFISIILWLYLGKFKTVSDKWVLGLDSINYKENIGK